MTTELLERKFRDVGVPLQLLDHSWFGINVRRGAAGERIALSTGDSSVEVMDADRDHAQLLLLIKTDWGSGRTRKSKILCGRDERSLFAVGVRSTIGVPVNSVATAHEALKPPELREPEGGRRRRGHRRQRPPDFVRQGDWFFVPHPSIPLQTSGIRKRQRLAQVGGNAHLVEYLLGDPRTLISPWPGVAPHGVVYARGFVRHPEHRTIRLRGWHRVLPNLETHSASGNLYRD